MALDGDQAWEEYRKGDSLQIIADRWNTYPKNVQRLILKAGGKMRSFEAAQRLAIKKGRAEHPTKGRERTDEEKEAISNGVKENFDNLPYEEKQRLVEEARKRWNEKPLEAIVEMRGKSKIALLATAKYGSKIERFLYEGLIGAGYRVEPHRSHLIGNDDMHIDLLLPELRVAIEVDGPTHHLPVYGIECLLKKQEADLEKNRALLAEGLHVVRVKILGRTDSLVLKKRILAKLIETVELVKAESPKLSLLDVEVLRNGKNEED